MRKTPFFRRKLSKIAENCDHNIDPWLPELNHNIDILAKKNNKYLFLNIHSTTYVHHVKLNIILTYLYSKEATKFLESLTQAKGHLDRKQIHRSNIPFSAHFVKMANLV
jgi:hypothetical protein